MGYTSQEVAVGNKTQLDIKLQSSLNKMNEVVIIGYQAIRSRDVTGAITTFDAARQLKDSPVNDAADALAGRLAGVQITGAEGSLESDPRIVIKGGGYRYEYHNVPVINGYGQGAGEEFTATDVSFKSGKSKTTFRINLVFGISKRSGCKKMVKKRFYG
jgi:hypothetical protein